MDHLLQKNNVQIKLYKIYHIISITMTILRTVTNEDTIPYALDTYNKCLSRRVGNTEIITDATYWKLHDILP